MKTLPTYTYAVEYCYPSSPNADRFNRPKGCWVIERSRDGHAPVALKAFNSRMEAQIALSGAMEDAQ